LITDPMLATGGTMMQVRMEMGHLSKAWSVYCWDVLLKTEGATLALVVLYCHLSCDSHGTEKMMQTEIRPCYTLCLVVILMYCQ
jgi:hypothetical protein